MAICLSYLNADTDSLLQGINTLRNNKKLQVYFQLGARLELTDEFCSIMVNTPKYKNLPVKIKRGRFLSANHYYINFHHHLHFVS